MISKLTTKKSPEREHIEAEIENRAKELETFFQKEINKGMDVRSARESFQKQMNEFIDFYKPFFLADVPQYVLEVNYDLTQICPINRTKEEK